MSGIEFRATIASMFAKPARRVRPLRALRALSAIALVVAPFVLASACASRGPDLASRMASQQTAAAAVGYTPSGASFNGTLEDGKDKREARLLKEGCYLICA